MERIYDTAASKTAIDAGLRSYMLKVYNIMAMGVAFTGVIVMVMATQPALLSTLAIGPGKWVVFIALLGLGWFAPRLIMSGSAATAQICYWLYAGLWGVLIAPLVVLFLNIPGGLADIARAFFITTAMFAGASLFGYVTKRDLSALGRFFLMAMIGLLVAMLVNVFFVESTAFSMLTSAAVVLLFAGLTAYETQMIKNLYLQQAGQAGRLAIFGAFMLYGSFITMFIHVLSLLGMMRGGE